MRTARVLMAGAFATLAACSGGGGDGGGTATSVFTSLDVAPTGTQSVLVGATQTLTVTGRDQNSASMSGLTTTFASGNQAIATVTNAGVITGVAVGTTTITVTGTIGSVTKTATVNVAVFVPGPTASVEATASNSFNPRQAFVTRGGVVTWTFSAQHNVTFDTQGSPANIGDRATGTGTATFPTAGTFAYHCTIHGQSMSGTVVVN